VTLRWVIASIHLLALGIGLGAIVTRARGLQTARREPRLRTILVADNLWGLSGLLFLGTGLWRAFGGLEKGTEYYLQHPLFHAKLGLFVLVLLLEIWPFVTLIKWRRSKRRGERVSIAPAKNLARISYVEALIVVVILFLATAIARGIGA
jgi:putative membrane protein